MAEKAARSAHGYPGQQQRLSRVAIVAQPEKALVEAQFTMATGKGGVGNVHEVSTRRLMHPPATKSLNRDRPDD